MAQIKDRQQFQIAQDEFIRSFEGDFDNLCTQILLFGQEAKSEPESMFVLVLLTNKAIPGVTILESIMDHPWPSEDDLKSALHQLMGYVANPDRRPGEDRESIYTTYIKEHRDNLAPGLVKHLLWGMPSRGFKILVEGLVEDATERTALLQRGYRIGMVEKELQKAAKRYKPLQLSPTIKEDIRYLSQRPEWWMRLYVARLIRLHSGFAPAEVRNRLKEDPVEAIREVMEEVESKGSKYGPRE